MTHNKQRKRAHMLKGVFRGKHDMRMKQLQALTNELLSFCYLVLDIGLVVIIVRDEGQKAG